MTRDEFSNDYREALRLLSELGVDDELAQEVRSKIIEGNRGARAVTPNDLQRYTDAIDWERKQDPRSVQQLAKVLLRITIGLARELETFRQAVER
jgi:hypothetical protein